MFSLMMSSRNNMLVILVVVVGMVLLSSLPVYVSGQRCHGLHGLVEMNTEVKRAPSFMELVEQLHGMCTPEYDSYGCNTCQPYVDSNGRTICVKVICTHTGGSCVCDTLTAESAVLCDGGGHLASSAVQAATMDYRADRIRAAAARGQISPTDAAAGANAALGMSVCSRPGQRNCWKSPPEEVSDDPVYQTPAQAQKLRLAERIQQLNTGFNGMVPGFQDSQSSDRSSNSNPYSSGGANTSPYYNSGNTSPMGVSSGNQPLPSRGGNGGGTAIGAAGWYSLSETHAKHQRTSPVKDAATPAPAHAAAPKAATAPSRSVDVPHCMIVGRVPASKGKKEKRGKRLCGTMRVSEKHPAAVAYAKVLAADHAKSSKKTTTKTTPTKQSNTKKVGPIQPAQF